MKTDQKIYDVADIGGGVVTAAKFWARARYTNVQSMILFEKYPGPGQLNSGVDKNSQTLHFGDIEANYLLHTALHVKEAGTMVANYARIFNVNIFQRLHKMLLAVGPREISELRKRYDEFKNGGYPGIQWLDKNKIAEKEPKIVEGRSLNEEIAAIYSSDGHAISFQKLSESFIENAKKSGKDLSINYNTTVIKIERNDGIYQIHTNNGIYQARVINVAAGAHSLVFAHSLGYGKEFTLLPLAGSFYISNRVLNGKVYTMQNPDIPFAAPHGDPPFNNTNETRFGPTAKLIPFLERHSPSTFFDFIRILPRTISGWMGLISATLFNRRLSSFMFKNLFYDLPIIGKWLYLQQIKKIIPSMRYRDLRFGRNIGGLRPQMIDVQKNKIVFRLHLIKGSNAIFNIAPSPGGSACLQNAKENLQVEAGFFPNYHFDEKRFEKDLETEIYSGAAP